MSDEAIEKANAELNKLKMMSPMSAEASVVRGYIEWLVGVLGQSAARLSTISSGPDHPRSGSLRTGRGKRPYRLPFKSGSENLKARCFVSLDHLGVGKTSLGESIAKSTNRKFVRMALGGVRDEVEIRGVIGSMPGN